MKPKSYLRYTVRFFSVFALLAMQAWAQGNLKSIAKNIQPAVLKTLQDKGGNAAYRQFKAEIMAQPVSYDSTSQVKTIPTEDDILPLYLRTVYGRDIISMTLQLASFNTVAQSNSISKDPEFQKMKAYIQAKAEQDGFTFRELKSSFSLDEKSPPVEEPLYWIVKPERDVKILGAMHGHLDTVKGDMSNEWYFQPYPGKLILRKKNQELPSTVSDLTEFEKARDAAGLKNADYFTEVAFDESISMFDEAALSKISAFGRGVLDDKTTFALLYYSMKAAEDAQLNTNIAVYGSLGEEAVGRWDPSHKVLEADPETPRFHAIVDSGGLVVGEGGLTNLTFTFPKKDYATSSKAKSFDVAFFGTNHKTPNQVPDNASAVLSPKGWASFGKASKFLNAKLEEYKKIRAKSGQALPKAIADRLPMAARSVLPPLKANDYISLEANEAKSEFTIKTFGYISHTMNSNKDGHNAIKELATFLGYLGIQDKLNDSLNTDVVRFIYSNFHLRDPYGATMNLQVVERMGMPNSVANLTLIRHLENGDMQVYVDYRFPHSTTEFDQIVAAKKRILEEKLKEYPGVTLKMNDQSILSRGYILDEKFNQFRKDVAELTTSVWGIPFEETTSLGRSHAAMMQQNLESADGVVGICFGPWPTGEMADKFGYHGFNEHAPLDVILKGAETYTKLIYRVHAGKLSLPH